jgi:hypothetical protein
LGPGLEGPDSTRATALLEEGITTFVVGLETQVDPCLLARMALRAGTAPATCPYNDISEFTSCDFNQPQIPSQCYYSVTSVEQLYPAFEAISRQVSEEICDGIDNNCSGVIDDLVAPCTTLLCGAGERECNMGEWEACVPFHQPAHICDCDGLTVPGRTRPCETICEEGVEVCIDGRWQDCSARLPETEICGDDIDNDCNGLTDEDCDDWCENGAQKPCGVSDVGRCRLGVRTCVGNEWGACEGAIGPRAEECNSQDDDCNGLTDDGLARACETACGSGTERCEMGDWVDCDARAPGPETCNNQDDDCNGLTDDGVERPCTTPCGEGVEMCVRGQWLACSAGMPRPETCNGRDDDCNGLTDDGDDLCMPGEVCVDGQCVPEPVTPAPDPVDDPDIGLGGEEDDGSWLGDDANGGRRGVVQGSSSCEVAAGPNRSALALFALLLLGLTLHTANRKRRRTRA